MISHFKQLFVLDKKKILSIIMHLFLYIIFYFRYREWTSWVNTIANCQILSSSEYCQRKISEWSIVIKRSFNQYLSEKEGEREREREEVILFFFPNVFNVNQTEAITNDLLFLSNTYFIFSKLSHIDFFFVQLINRKFYYWIFFLILLNTWMM
jgi:hypothetical protein